MMFIQKIIVIIVALVSALLAKDCVVPLSQIFEIHYRGFPVEGLNQTVVHYLCDKGLKRLDPGDKIIGKVKCLNSGCMVTNSVFFQQPELLQTIKKIFNSQRIYSYICEKNIKFSESNHHIKIWNWTVNYLQGYLYSKKNNEIYLAAWNPDVLIYRGEGFLRITEGALDLFFNNDNYEYFVELVKTKFRNVWGSERLRVKTSENSNNYVNTTSLSLLKRRKKSNSHIYGVDCVFLQLDKFTNQIKINEELNQNLVKLEKQLNIEKNSKEELKIFLKEKINFFRKIESKKNEYEMYIKYILIPIIAVLGIIPFCLLLCLWSLSKKISSLNYNKSVKRINEIHPSGVENTYGVRF